jgi:hypothetical protein
LGAEDVPVSRKSQFVMLMPWAGLVVGLVAAAFVHQFGAEGVFNDCRAISPVPLLIVSLVGLLASLGAGAASLRSARTEAGAARVVAVISVGMAALFAFAILLPMAAALILPPCFG